MKDDLLVKNHHHRLHNGTTKSYTSPPLSSSTTSRALPRLMIYLILFISMTYVVYTLKLLSSHPCPSSSADRFSRLPSSSNLSIADTHQTIRPIQLTTAINTTKNSSTAIAAEKVRGPTFLTEPTSFKHVVFGIAASSRLWDKRKEYIKLWYRPRQMRGVVWLDKPVTTRRSEVALLPPIKISSDTSSFAYTNKQGHRSAIRISRIVTETLRLGLTGVRWFVMGDDDTVFLPDNLLRVLSRFDHRHYYYIGSLSESHLQNIYFSYGMAYGGGGFAISYPLAAALSKMQDKCIQRYPALYGSDDRMQACMAELGVPLTRHPGFHQYDVYGNLFGLLAAHPVAPLVSLHHLDVVEPVFPNETRPAALGRIFAGPVKLDSAGVMQQSICYEGSKKWTVSVSWGFAVQIIRGVVSPREMEMPTRTFLNWYRRADYTAYAFNTRPVARNPCQRPFVYYLHSARLDGRRNQTVTQYGPRRLLGGGGSSAQCRWKMADPTSIDKVVVYKRPDPSLWDRSPRRNCCRVLREGEGGKRTMAIEVGVCKDVEISEI